MQIYVDADKVIKEVLFRAAERLQIPLTLVANKLLAHPPSQVIRALQVPAGFDVADSKIVELVETGDLVITADISLAAEVITRVGTTKNGGMGQYVRTTQNDKSGHAGDRENLKTSMGVKNYVKR